MKVYRVVTERDGETKKEPGKTSTELLREEHRFAAETMQEVWDAIGWLRDDPERVLLAVIEEAPAIKVLGHNYKGTKQDGTANKQDRNDAIVNSDDRATPNSEAVGDSVEGQRGTAGAVVGEG